MNTLTGPNGSTSGGVVAPDHPEDGPGRMIPQTDNSDKTDNTQQMDSTAQTSNSDETPVREKKHVPMYLSEEKAEQLDMYFEELSLRHRKEHGEPLQKNRDFYPALVEALTEDKDIEEVLGLSED